MQRATLSLLALIKHYPALLDEFELPEAIEREPFINRLLLEQGQQEVSITNPEVMAPLVGFWSRTRVRIWNKLADMVGYEYNPIWNVDGTTVHVGSSESHGTESGSSSEQRSGSRNYTRDRDQTDTLANTHNDTTDITRSETRTPNLTETTSPSGTETTINFIAADNSEGWSNDTKSERSFSSRSDSKRTTGTEATSGDQTETSSGGYTDTDTLAEDIEDTETTTDSAIGTSSGSRDQEGSDRWEETRQGNIGVTMTQQLLEAEQRLWEQYDVESFIIKEFKQEFLLMVY